MKHLSDHDLKAIREALDEASDNRGSMTVGFLLLIAVFLAACGFAVGHAKGWW